jgi:SAM-dependent methyltransferase
MLLLGVHGRSLKKRYQAIVEELGDVETVFEPMCGPALLPRYLPEDISYKGFDGNARFVRYAQKKDLTVWEGDATMRKSFLNHGHSNFVQADGVVLIDSMHHIGNYGAQQRLMEKAARSVNSGGRIVVCDPFGDRYFKMIGKGKIRRWAVEKFFNWIERDGFNKVRFENIPTRDTLEERMKDGYGVLSGLEPKIQQVGKEDLIATYQL